jgi:hypothetical protein
MLARAVPAVLALALTGVIGADVAVAADLRAEARAKAAAAAEKRALAAYRTSLRPIAEAVYDQVQPLMEAAEEVGHPGPDTAQIMADVLGRTGAAGRLRSLRARLIALPAPGRVHAKSAAVVTAFDLLLAAVETAERAVRDTKGGEGDVADAGSSINEVARQWGTPVAAAFGDTTRPALPSGSSTRPRAPQSRGAYVMAVDRLCSESIDTELTLPPMDTPQQVAVSAPRYAKFMRSVLTGLRAVDVPASERARVERDIRAHLGPASKAADGMELVATALRTQSPSTGQRGLNSIVAGLRASQKLSRGMSRYGATVCGDVFAIDDADIAELAGEPAAVGTPA